MLAHARKGLGEKPDDNFPLAIGRRHRFARVSASPSPQSRPGHRIFFTFFLARCCRSHVSASFGPCLGLNRGPRHALLKQCPEARRHHATPGRIQRLQVRYLVIGNVERLRLPRRPAQARTSAPGCRRWLFHKRSFSFSGFFGLTLVIDGLAVNRRDSRVCTVSGCSPNATACSVIKLHAKTHNPPPRMPSPRNATGLGPSSRHRSYDFFHIFTRHDKSRSA